jgi:methylmalonyl-CoA mutase
MTEQSIHTILKETFSKSSKEDWLRIALQELKDQKSIDDLAWKSGNLKFSPYYDKIDLNASNRLSEERASPDITSYSKAAGWYNLPKIIVTDEKEANAIGLTALSTAADGVLFDISGHNNVDLKTLLKNIDWSFCNISFITSEDENNIAAKISSYLNEQSYDKLAVRGGIFCQQVPELRETAVNALSSFKNFQSSGFIVQRASPVDEISASLMYGVTCLEHLTAADVQKEIAFQSICVSLATDENFFVTIAKFKALRALWYQLSQAYQIKSYEPNRLHLHSRSETGNHEKFEPHANILKNTCDAIASVLGGANALTMYAEQDNATMYRVALHTSNILKEESYFDKVANAIEGAYTIEVMVRDFSEAAWKDFQNKAIDL